MDKRERVLIGFSAESNIEERVLQGIEFKNPNSYVSYGIKNDYPNFLYDTFSNSPTLSSLVNGFVQYIAGDDVVGNTLKQPNPYQSWFEFITELSNDYVMYGCCYIHIVNNRLGTPSELYVLDAQFVRTDENNESFWYNQKFGSGYIQKANTIRYPKYKADLKQPSGVMMIKTPTSRNTYGTPFWISGLKDAVIETETINFNYSEIQNNFAGSAIINFNNGIPTEEEKAEIQKLIKKKLTGSCNAGKFMLSFNDGKDNATTVERLQTDDFPDRYLALAKKTRENLFTAFSAPPQLFGVYIEGTGFNSQEYQESFKIFNKTKILPIQRRLVDQIDKILGMKGSITIKPFSINFEEDAKENNVN